jgi:hypothetical protein
MDSTLSVGAAKTSAVNQKVLVNGSRKVLTPSGGDEPQAMLRAPGTEPHFALEDWIRRTQHPAGRAAGRREFLPLSRYSSTVARSDLLHLALGGSSGGPAPTAVLGQGHGVTARAERADLACRPLMSSNSSCALPLAGSEKAMVSGAALVGLGR